MLSAGVPKEGDVGEDEGMWRGVRARCEPGRVEQRMMQTTLVPCFFRVPTSLHLFQDLENERRV